MIKIKTVLDWSYPLMSRTWRKDRLELYATGPHHDWIRIKD